MEEVRGISLKSFLESFNRMKSHSCIFRITRMVDDYYYVIDVSSSGLPALYDTIKDDVEFYDWHLEENADGQTIIEILIEDN